MNIKTMRLIDRWVGMFLCFSVTLLDLLFRFLHLHRGQKKTINKILIIKLSEIGSIILSYPLIRKLQKNYSGAQIYFLTFKKNEDVFSILELVPELKVVGIREYNFFVFIYDSLKAVIKLRKENIDIVFDLELFSRFSSLMSYLICRYKRVGFYRYCFEGLYRGNFLTHKVQYNPLIHIAKLFLSFAQVADLKRKDTPELFGTINQKEIQLPHFVPPVELKNQVILKLKALGVSDESRLFLINPGEGDIPLREWQIENFIVISKMILEQEACNYIIIVGNGNVDGKPEILFNALGDKRSVNLNKKTTLPELLTICSLAKMLITNDCGLAHLASLSSIKKFILFGPESPQIYSPLGDNVYIIYTHLPCSPCLSTFNHRNSLCLDNRCLKIIDPTQVFELLMNHF